LLKINVTGSTLKKDLEENPFYPSLLSISETFDKYNVTNAAYNYTSQEFYELNAPFIALINFPSIGGDFVLVTEITNEKVHFIHDKEKPQIIPKQQFVDRFAYTVLFAEPDESSGEIDFLLNRKKETVEKNKTFAWFAAIATIILLIFAVNIQTSDVIAFTTLSLIKLTGFAVTLLLLAFDLDKSNMFIKKLCGIGPKTNCDAVLASKGSKIWGISWSEIGFIYFAFSALILFNPSFSFPYKVACCAILNLFASPYIIFSIYYQARVVRQWCPLCITVQTMLAMELVWGIIYFWTKVNSIYWLTSAENSFFLQSVFLVLIPVVGWYGLKPTLLKAKDDGLYKSAYKKLQNNPEIFNSLLVQQLAAPENWEDIGVEFGDPGAENTIISVCSSTCSPCAEAHPKLEEILHNNKNVKLKVIFSGSNPDYKGQIRMASDLSFFCLVIYYPSGRYTELPHSPYLFEVPRFRSPFYQGISHSRFHSFDRYRRRCTHIRVS
jgi:uncharacterized membrane protein